MTILIDASLFYAYSNTNDVHHTKAKEILKDILSDKYGGYLTTDYIFDEVVTVAQRKAGKKTAVELGNFILNSEILVAEIDKNIFENSWKLFRETEDLSFTDCTNIEFMKIFGIENIATFDRDFEGIEGIKIVK